MSDTITLSGVIKFDPKDRTNKHKKQSKWKKVAMILFDGDITEYYSWWVKKRYGIQLNKPLRGAHITFISDKSENVINWDRVKNKYHNTNVTIKLNLTPKTDSNDPNSSYHWWLTVPEAEREPIHNIRRELGLPRPYFGLHMTIGYCNEKNVEQSKYIHRLILNGIIK